MQRKQVVGSRASALQSIKTVCITEHTFSRKKHKTRSLPIRVDVTGTVTS